MLPDKSFYYYYLIIKLHGSLVELVDKGRVEGKEIYISRCSSMFALPVVWQSWYQHG